MSQLDSFIANLIGQYNYDLAPVDFHWIFKAFLVLIAVYMMFRLFLTLLHRIDKIF